MGATEWMSEGPQRKHLPQKQGIDGGPQNTGLASGTRFPENDKAMDLTGALIQALYL